MVLSTVPPIKQLPQSLQGLIDDLQQVTTLYPVMVQRCLKSAMIPCHDIWPWQRFKHSPSQSYGRAQIFQSDSFEITAFSWLPGDFSAIHSRNTLGAALSFGEAEYTEFHYDGDLLSTASISSFKTGTTVQIPLQCIHQMGNPSPRPFMTLHVDVHVPSDVSLKVFDLYDVSIQSADYAFFGLTNANVHSRKTGLRGDRLTTLRHHQKMLKRVLNIQHEYIHSLYLQDLAERLMAEITFLQQ